MARLAKLRALGLRQEAGHESRPASQSAIRCSHRVGQESRRPSGRRAPCPCAEGRRRALVEEEVPVARAHAYRQGELPAQPATSLRLLPQDEDALGPANVDYLAVVTAYTDSFAEMDDGAGYKLPGRVASQIPRAATLASPRHRERSRRIPPPAQRLWFVMSPVTSHHHWINAGRGGNRDDN
jgi:hypothetical protein